MIRFKATEEQIQNIAVNAVKASQPMGAGFMVFNPRDEFLPEQFKFQEGLDGKPELHLDYVGGRMVKLNIWGKGDDVWETRDQADPEYQSWCRQYRTPQELLASVPGVEVS